MTVDAAPLDTRTTTVFAPAKLNLRLDLLGKRADSLHELCTAFATLSLGDTIVARVDDRPDKADDSLMVVGDYRLTAGVPTGRDNLALRALAALRRAAEDDGVAPPRGLSLTLTKRVPSQAGLGGGSSDAAAALVAADRLWGLGWPTARLADIAATLGSDISFFVHAIRNRSVKAAIATGRGETIEPIPVRGGLPVVLIKPTAGLSTAAVYGACSPDDYTRTGSAACVESCRQAIALAGGRSLRGLKSALDNGLQAAAVRVAPWLVETFDRVRRIAGSVMLSGSGTACFAPAPSVSAARRMARRLEIEGIGRAWAVRLGG